MERLSLITAAKLDKITYVIINVCLMCSEAYACCRQLGADCMLDTDKRKFGHLIFHQI